MQKLHLGAAQCALDLGDGSERAEYVNQDYIRISSDVRTAP